MTANAVPPVYDHSGPPHGSSSAHYNGATQHKQPTPHEQSSQYLHSPHFDHAVPGLQSASSEYTAAEPAAAVHQPAGRTAQSQSNPLKAAPEPASDSAFDVDSWLLDMGVGPASPKQQAPLAAPSVPAQTSSSIQQPPKPAQGLSQNGSSSLSRPQSAGSDSSRLRYKPPHLRVEPTDLGSGVPSSPQPPAYSDNNSHSSAAGRKPPPGFPASAGF